MRIIIGYGNSLRGEDAFGVDVINQLQKNFNDSYKKDSFKDTKLISTFQLTPELCLELLDAKKLIFIDALYSKELKHTLACSIKQGTKATNLSHHISPEIIVSILDKLYNRTFTYEIFSMTTCSFEENDNFNKHYLSCVEKVATFLTQNY